MRKLNMLILCLLVSCSLISQTDTTKTRKTEVVVLDQATSIKVVKDLEDYDTLKVIEQLQRSRITNLEAQVQYLEDLNKKKDMIIELNYEMLDNKDKIIDAKKPIEFHGYGGGQVINDFMNFSLYFKAQFETKKVNFGGQINANLQQAYEMPGAWYNLYVEFKIF